MTNKRHVRMTLTVHQARLVMIEAEHNVTVTTSEKDRMSWEAIAKSAQKAVEYHQQREEDGR